MINIPDKHHHTFVLLQNAWAYRPERFPNGWPYDSWVWALRRSRTGQRLSRIFNESEWDGSNIAYGDTTPKIGNHSGSIFPPDIDYCTNLFNRFTPKVVIACGKQASKVASELWKSHLICMPHPACRIVTNVLLDKVKSLRSDIEVDAAAQRYNVIQGRGFVTVDELP
jgi:hypothetical protein